MKKLISLILIGVLLLAGCDKQQTVVSDVPSTIFVTDSLGREIELDANLIRVAPCGSVAQMILYTLAPERLVGWATNPDERTKPYIPKEYWKLPQLGQLYGKNVTLNIEALVAAGPQVIIDMGDIKENMKEDLTSVSKQVGIPIVFIEATLEKMPEAYRTLGTLLNKEEKAEELARYCERTLAMAEEIANQVKLAGVVTAYYGTGGDGLACNAKGSIHAEVLDILAVANAAIVENVSQKGGGNQVDMEQMMLFNPDIILLAASGAYDKVFSDAAWCELDAVKNGRVYEIPHRPYDFLSSPPTINRMIGVHWLAWVAYPEYYKLNLGEEMKTFYRLFYDYELSETEIQELLKNAHTKVQ